MIAKTVIYIVANTSLALIFFIVLYFFFGFFRGFSVATDSNNGVVSILKVMQKNYRITS